MKNRELEIAEVAYELYQSRGCVDGYELIDWLEAERIITAKHLTIGGLTAGEGSHLPRTALSDDGKGGGHTTVSARTVPKKAVTKKAAAESVSKKTTAKKTAAKKAAPKRTKT